MRKTLLGLFALVLLVVPASAITGGAVDPGNVHPNVCVVIIRADLLGDGTRFALCSGTLIHERAVLTAGHCVALIQSFLAQGYMSDIGQVTVNFGPTYTPSAPNAAGNFAASAAVLHPNFNPNLARNGVSDIGLLILADSVNGITPATLPTPGYMDALKKSGDLGPGTTLRLAGFGTYLDPVAPPTPTLGTPPWPRRYVDVNYRQILKRQFQASNNQHLEDRGGSCFGDSGGPAFLQDPTTGEPILVGVTSWGDEKCIGTGLCARTDIADVLSFIDDNLP